MSYPPTAHKRSPNSRTIIIIVLVISATLASVYFLSGLDRRPPVIIPPPPSSIIDPQTPTPAPAILAWNGCGSGKGWGTAGCNITASSWIEYVVPDTFDLFVSYNSTVPLTVNFLTLAQYSQFAYCYTVSCISGSFRTVGPSTSVNTYIFKLAEGCADYVAIFRASSSGVWYPNLWVTHNASPSWTGICAMSK